jgi:PEP-CTERM motif-containing protein
MRRPNSPYVALFVVAVLWCTPVPVPAEPVQIVITSGSFSFDPDSGEGGPLQLLGPDGFSFAGNALSGGAGPSCCLSSGESTSFFGSWSSNDLPGTATYRGETFTHIGGPISVNQMRVEFHSSSFTLPLLPGPSSITITAPFTLTGRFTGAPGTGDDVGIPTVEAALIGRGVGTLPFTVDPDGGWNPGIARLEFVPVPEPGVLTLLGFGLAGGIWMGRRRRRKANC